MKRIVALLMLVCLLCAACFAYAQTLTNGYAIDQTVEALGVALTVETLYYDGVTFHLDWRTENLRPETPALVLYTEVTVDGVPVNAVADHPAAHWYPQVFGLFVADEAINNLAWCFLAQVEGYAWKGEVEVTSSFVVKRPTKPMVVVDPEIHVAYENEDTETDRQAMLEAMQAHGVTIAQPDEMDVEAWQKRGYLVVNRYGEHFLEDESVGRAALAGLDLPDAEEKEVKISFRVDLDALIDR
ncbi:MAG: hypothetical protein FWE77_04010 [Clostridia bacterium]|nr:hypothetical protein [Clostridia bacterium]